ncbi:acyltransferase [Desulfosudis oleivorans]|uniref:Phospholipid/glycerol acyltransferase n=1 Tax=Desulfosudis oleivorans (strain DSM 6200 / JCM 39069 / Hxd3) TaxID=96561 RepID=A8ZXL0_DESOH|nr:acyltransferase [Desulfosudis oleivorans]ABW66968.1 phospholipid/glycerol acyltransferase [Desulfosudis oleivorans Hxd3]
MSGSVFGVVRGSLSMLCYVVNTVFWCIPLYTIALVKLIVPVAWFRRICNRLLIAVSFSWIFCNNINQKIFSRTPIIATGLEGLDQKGWYLVVSNHQSWVDILVLQRVFYHRIPFLKFFLKKELIWVPVMGFAWWALDFPFMKRYSGAFLKKYPHLKGKDIEITKKACEKFSTMPVSVMNFLEGTRFTTGKHARQQSPYAHLLRPKAGGIAFVLASMGGSLKSIVNVTIAYPPGPKSFWDFVCGRISRIRVHVETIPITANLIGDYFEDEAFRNRFQVWVNDLWEAKEKQIQQLHGEYPLN